MGACLPALSIFDHCRRPRRQNRNTVDPIDSSRNRASNFDSQDPIFNNAYMEKYGLKVVCAAAARPDIGSTEYAGAKEVQKDQFDSSSMKDMRKHYQMITGGSGNSDRIIRTVSLEQKAV